MNSTPILFRHLFPPASSKDTTRPPERNELRPAPPPPAGDDKRSDPAAPVVKVEVIKGPPSLGERFARTCAPSSAVGLVAAAMEMPASSAAALSVIVGAWIAAWDSRERLPVRPWWFLPLICSLVGGMWISRMSLMDALLDAMMKRIGCVERVVLNANDAMKELGEKIDKSEKTIELAGVNFYTSVPRHRDRLLQRLKNGVDVRFLILSPNSEYFDEVASGFGQTSDELRVEYNITVENLKGLEDEAKKLNAPGRLEVRAYKSFPRIRLYMFDRKLGTGSTILVPHGYGMDSANLPAYFVTHSPKGVAPSYHKSWDLLWEVSGPAEELPGMRPVKTIK